jgi:hypothetical protein
MRKATPEQNERRARELSAKTLLDVRTVRKYLAGDKVSRAAKLALDAAKVTK